MTSQILLFDTPRSAATLLERILSKQPRRQLLDTPLSQCRGMQVQWLTSETWEQGMPDEQLARFDERAQEGIFKWREALTQAQQDGKILMVHDHPFSSASPHVVLNFIKTASKQQNPTQGNFTLIPNDLLLAPGTIPILTIRDPRLTVPSTYRVLRDFGLPHGSGGPNFTISTTPAWLRMLYDFFTSNGIQPVVVDADDVMTDTDFIRGLAEQVGLDPEQLYFEWKKPTEVERAKLHPMFYASQKKLIESEGINAERAAINIDMGAEMGIWKFDFGEDLELVKEMVDLAMPHYQWLRERRFKK